MNSAMSLACLGMAATLLLVGCSVSTGDNSVAYDRSAEEFSGSGSDAVESGPICELAEARDVMAPILPAGETFEEIRCLVPEDAAIIDFIREKEVWKIDGAAHVYQGEPDESILYSIYGGGDGCGRNIVYYPLVDQYGLGVGDIRDGEQSPTVSAVFERINALVAECRAGN